MATTLPVFHTKNKTLVYSGVVFLGALVFSLLLGWVNLVQYNWLSPQFERISTPTTWGLLQRLFLIVPAAVILVWRPRQIGLQLGTITLHWRMLLVMLVLNVGIIGGYLALTGATPYSGFNMLVNEVVTVPLVEEVVWRGIIFAALVAVLNRFLPAAQSGMLAAVYSGICFGLLHGANALVGYPLPFVALQVVNATIWGIVYGIARAKTGSLYPPILLHAAMNLVVVLV
jgi:membrane protease YdiL (CAAX protease family)